MPSPDLWGAVTAILRANRIPAAFQPTHLTITLSVGPPLAIPLYPPEVAIQIEDAVSEFMPNAGQERILAALYERPRTSTQLRELEPHLYEPRGGLRELEQRGLVERSAKWALTPFGRDWWEENRGGSPEDE